jgi:hypothetical protein
MVGIVTLWQNLQATGLPDMSKIFVFQEFHGKFRCELLESNRLLTQEQVREQLEGHIQAEQDYQDFKSDGDQHCGICQSAADAENMLLCDGGCDQGFHTDCLDPPLFEIPAGAILHHSDILTADLRRLGV